jgi:hypothetical protein
MPAQESTVGSAAMNTLVALAQASDDAAFLLRARRRLFPTLDAPKTQTVRATLDWVMFRRARTHLCGPACQTPAPLGIMSFLVWHLKVDSKEELAKLTAALDAGNEQALAAFAFKRVGILHYRDESTFAQESADRVVAMWEPAKPAPEVVLGRAWETVVSASQGWQDPLRLRNMLEQIATLTKPPPAAALAAIPVPSKSLSDGALDGGMLVVTTGKAPEPVPVTKRKALAIYAGRDSVGGVVQHFPEKNAPQSNVEFQNDVPTSDALIALDKELASKNAAVKGITLATVKAVDAGAKTRLDAVVAALAAAGIAKPPAERLVTEQLSKPDRDNLVKISVNPDDYDEIIFHEKN